MSDKINFLGGLVPSYREEYKERLKYKKLINLDGLIDIWYDNYEYGFLNKNYEPVVLAEESISIKNFAGLADGVGCLNFVAGRFMDFRKEYLEKLNKTTIDFPPFINGATPASGHESFDTLYANWSAYSAVKYSSFLQSDTSINDYSCFLTALKKALASELGKFPITKSGFCLSRHNDIKTTGLVIELADLNYNIDLHKGEMVQSLDFSCFLELANKHGFYVDKNAPWRMLANLDSDIMRSSIRGLVDYRKDDEKHRSFSTMDILDNIYRTRTHFDDLYNLQDFVLKTYNQIIREVPSYTKETYNSRLNKPVKKDVFRTGPQTLMADQWLDLLVYVRLLEMNRYTENNYAHYCGMVKKVNNVYGVRAALGALGTEMATLIKEDFTSRRKLSIMDNNTNLRIRTESATRVRPSGDSNPRY